MARMKSISTIETELKKAEADLKKAQEKLDILSDKVLELQKRSRSMKPNGLSMPTKRAEKRWKNC